MVQGTAVIFIVVQYVIQSSVFLTATLLSGGVDILLQVSFSKTAW